MIFHISLIIYPIRYLMDLMGSNYDVWPYIWLYLHAQGTTMYVILWPQMETYVKIGSHHTWASIINLAQIVSKDSHLVKYFAFFSLRKTAINIIFVYLESLNKALQLPFWVKFSHGQLSLGSYEMRFMKSVPCSYEMSYEVVA